MWLEKVLKVSTVIAVSGCSYLAFEIGKTRIFFEQLLDKKVFAIERKQPQYIYLEEPEVQDVLELLYTNDRSFKLKTIDLAIKTQFKFWRLKYLKWLMSIALCNDCEYRLKAIQILSKSKLTDTQYAQLAQMCDARIAVSLAREKNTDVRFFGKRSTSPHAEFTIEELIIRMRDLLVNLNKNNEHECLTYFLSTTFPGFHSEKGTFFDIEIKGRIRQSVQYTEEMLMRCVRELVHYCEIGDNAAGIAKTQGLQVIMDVYKSIGDKEKPCDFVEFAKLIQSVSLFPGPGTLQQLFVTGWIKVLAEWLHSNDRNMCVRAAHSLANLDEDDVFEASYGRELLLLHPLHHRHNPNILVDVVFIHGLLGGALVTWRQRDKNANQLTIYDFRQPTKHAKKRFKRSDKTADKYIKTVTDLKREEWEKIGSDFEFVFCDFPTKSETNDSDFTIPGTDPSISNYLDDEEDEYISSCWPQDWLAKDYPKARILSVDYITRLSDWQFSCMKNQKNAIETTAKNILDQCIASGIGDRPVVWVVHSMGGLILKSMLLKAYDQNDTKMQKLHQNTKAIVFISTPHFGSHIATMFDSTRLVWWPSEEVNDLRVNSQFLLDLHEKFKEWASKFPDKVLSFTETKSTELSGLGLKFEFMIVTPESGGNNLVLTNCFSVA